MEKISKELADKIREVFEAWYQEPGDIGLDTYLDSIAEEDTSCEACKYNDLHGNEKPCLDCEGQNFIPKKSKQRCEGCTYQGHYGCSIDKDCADYKAADTCIKCGEPKADSSSATIRTEYTICDKCKEQPKKIEPLTYGEKVNSGKFILAEKINEVIEHLNGEE